MRARRKNKDDVFRLFTCSCGHKLRYGAGRCGKCYYRTHMLNRHGNMALAAVCGIVVFSAFYAI